MGLITNLLEKMGRKRIIHARNGSEEYMHRYYLWKMPKEHKTKEKDYDDEKNHSRFNVFLHNFKLSDDPILHDHPWPWFSLILKGGYWEHLEDGSSHWRGPGSFIFRKATDLHWVELHVDNRDTWSLFIHGKRCRKWGFLTPTGWMYWNDYVKMNRKKTSS